MGSADDESPSTGGQSAAEELAARRRAIELKLAAIETSALNMVGGIGFGKRIGEGTNIAVERFSDVAIHDALQAELETVRRAEQKLVDGDADCCDECGRVIPEERRLALPWAVRCVDCSR